MAEWSPVVPGSSPTLATCWICSWSSRVKCVGLAIPWSRVRVPLWPLARFVLGRPELKFSATLVNNNWLPPAS